MTAGVGLSKLDFVASKIRESQEGRRDGGTEGRRNGGGRKMIGRQRPSDIWHRCIESIFHQSPNHRRKVWKRFETFQMFLTSEASRDPKAETAGSRFKTLSPPFPSFSQPAPHRVQSVHQLPEADEKMPQSVLLCSDKGQVLLTLHFTVP